MVYIFVSYLGNFFIPKGHKYFLFFLPEGLKVFSFIFRSLIHFQLFFCIGYKVRANVDFLSYKNSVGPAPFVDKTFPFPSELL